MPKKETHKFLSIADKLEKKGIIPEAQKEEIKEAIWEDKDFTEYCLNKKEWANEDHDKFKIIMDLNKNENGYYKDIYDNRVSYDGIRTLMKAGTELPLSKIHENEIEKCKNDFKYFRKHYCLITTRNGLARPELRHYQESLEDELLTLDDTVILFPRQSGKTITSATYLLWRSLFHTQSINIGIVANKPKTAREVLDKIKKIYIELPIWMKKGSAVWNKSEIEFENGTRVMTDSPSSDSFRGYTCNFIYVDEAAYIKKTLWDEFIDAVIPTMNSLTFKQVIMTSTANGMNHFEKIVNQAKRKDTSEKLVTCDWREVPHYDKKGKLLDPDEYKKNTIRSYGEKYFNQTEECVGGNTIINTLEYNDITIKELYEKEGIYLDGLEVKSEVKDA